MKAPPLSKAFLQNPLAHRGLHDLANGIPENSLPAFKAAAAAGYGIELDVQLSLDGKAMVFHDYNLSRLTGHKGRICEAHSEELSRLSLRGGEGTHIPTLIEVLDTVAGCVPLLIELKPRDRAMSGHAVPIAVAAARALEEYSGDIALMSYDPRIVAELARVADKVPRGLTTSRFNRLTWSVPSGIRQQLREIVNFNRVGASFISHDVRDLARSRVQMLRNEGVPVICWTVRTAKTETAARKLADNITFEGYMPSRSLPW